MPSPHHFLVAGRKLAAVGMPSAGPAIFLHLSPSGHALGVNVLLQAMTH